MAIMTLWADIDSAPDLHALVTNAERLRTATLLAEKAGCLLVSFEWQENDYHLELVAQPPATARAYRIYELHGFCPNIEANDTTEENWLRDLLPDPDVSIF